MSNLVFIETRIFNLRGEPVMIDRDLADMYQVETKVLNQAVKRNIERFPEQFRFQLNNTEKNELVTNCDRFQNLKHASNNPYAFTERGVAMLSAILRSKVAIQVSIQIMNAFVQMRKTIGNNLSLLQLSEDFKQHKLETDSKFEQVFKALEAPEIEHKQGVFFNGQTYDAYDFINTLIKIAKQQIILIDNYIDDTVITQLTKKKKNVEVLLLSKTLSKKLQLDIEKANTQYPTFTAISFAESHDRFLILDQKEVYHLGASLKDLGKKWFAFSKLETSSVTILNQIKELI